MDIKPPMGMGCPEARSDRWSSSLRVRKEWKSMVSIPVCELLMREGSEEKTFRLSQHPTFQKGDDVIRRDAPRSFRVGR